MEKVKIDKKKNEVIVKFNPFFYDGRYIAQAINDYGEACEIRAEEDTIILKPKEDIDINILGYEFYNYVLGLMKS